MLYICTKFHGSIIHGYYVKEGKGKTRLKFPDLKLQKYTSPMQKEEAVLLHGPSIFAVKAKIYGELFNQSTFIAFNETSTNWSAPKSS